MKHHTTCPECLDLRRGFVPSVGEVRSDLLAICTCEYDHKTVVSIGHTHCDVLYTSAVHAFVKECLSESVMSFAASLERSYEMFIKVTLFSEGLSYEEIDVFWKEISSQSERQYGAFCTQYFKMKKEPWKTDHKMVSFRNNVIHKGHIASVKEVTIYAEYITRTLYKILKHLIENYFKEFGEFYNYEKTKTEEKLYELSREYNARVSTSMFSSLLNLNTVGMPEISFSKAVKTMKRMQMSK